MSICPRFKPFVSSLFCFLLFVAVGCGHIPKQELTDYRNAFSEAQNASEAILIDFADAIEKGEAQRTNKPAPGMFSEELIDGRGPQPSAVEVRRLALRTIDRYNNVLATLAEGKSVEQLQSAAGGFVEVAEKFVEATAGAAPVPGLSSAVDLVKTLAGELEKARLRAEFKKAVQNGAPTVEKILTALIADRADHIRLRAVEANLRHGSILMQTTDAIKGVRELFEARSQPPTDDPKDELQKTLNDSLAPMASAFSFRLPVKLDYGNTNLPPFTAEQRVMAEQLIARIERLVTDYQANIVQFNSLKSALNSYGSLLERTRVTLQALSGAIDKPQDFESASEELFAVAFSIKRDIEAYRTARNSAP